ncbi:50S ribosomal protein L24 [Candidatus Woesebacteria bacterium RIFCSPLOWO2_01_FULL_37_19]|uniref:Large ribosomal subunit protein uL24 n=2 Tax=Candidatus Woeseibacteriota TaxID=1752722 RepID=A0A1F8B2F8_9BACT|nr:MAG: 50S ribosomal protein L24 [Candidatus Woesebacteria bacterium RIFCSPHIGHO2_01_FULL_38_26b]OGM58110.1 MAG: 50S ribosomal protein L24 [Candidatus Woesebacteria bacterium RIFCSPLOWO2_01_FULL_37_19]
MLKFKIGDKVKVTAGKDKGREGKIEKILPSESRALIPGVNIYKRHVKGRQGQKGGIFEIPRPLPFSNIILICPKCKKTTRVGFNIAGKEKKRICKKCKKEIDKI